MHEYTGKEKIFLYLSKQRLFERKVEVPYELCQNGISEIIDISQSRLSRIIKDMKKDGYLKEETKHITGLKHKRKTYFLTNKGYERAKKIEKKLRDMEVKIKTDEGIKEIKMGEIKDYVNTDHPYITALNKINDQGVVDLKQSFKRKEKIFIGREREMKRLRSELKKAKEGVCRTLFISGEAGIGKTTLVSELKPHAYKEEFDFLVGNSYSGSSDPYLPFKEAFEKYLERSKGMEGAMGIASIGIPSGVSVSDKRLFDSHRQTVFYDSTKWVEKIADEKPLVIFLDDLQWADNATLQLLHYMSSRLDESPVLFIGAYRPEDISYDHPLKDVLQKMSRLHKYEELELEPLDWKDTREVVKGLVGREDVPSDFVRLLHENTEGNPLFIKETVEEMLEEGIIEPKKGRYPSGKEELKIPAIINDVIERRIDRLSEETRKIIKTGSVIGYEVPFELLTKISDTDEVDIIEQIDILVGATLWQEEADEETFYFSHRLIRDVVYESISSVKKRFIHKRAAETIEEIYEGEIEDRYTDLAEHYENAEEYSKAFNYYLKIGERAEERYAHEDAIQVYKKALEMADELPEGEVDGFSIIESIADAYVLLGDYEDGRGYLEKGIEMSSTEEQKRRMYWKIGDTWRYQGEYDKSLEAIDKGLALQDSDTIEKCRLLGKKGWAYLRKGEYQKATKIFWEQKDVAEQIDDESLIGQSLHNLGSISYKKEELDNAVEMLDRAKGIIEKIDDLKGLGSTLNNLGVSYHRKGELDKALEYYERSLEKIDKLGDIWGKKFLLNNIGVIYNEKGEFEKGIEYYYRSLELSKMIGDKLGIGMAHENLGSLYIEKEDLDKAKGYLEKSLNIFLEIDESFYVINTYSDLAEIGLKKGNIEEAEDYVNRGLKLSHEIGAKGEGARCRMITGMIAREKKDWERSEGEFEGSLKLLDEAGEKDLLPRALYEYGLLYKMRGEKKKAEEKMKEALDRFEDMGMEFWAEKTKDQLNDLD